MNYVILIAKIFQFKEHSKLFMTFSLFMFACCVYVLSVWATGFKVHACAYFAVNVNVNVCVCVILTQTVGLLVVSVSFPVVAVTRVTGADHPAKVISALLFTGRASTHIHACEKAGA